MTKSLKLEEFKPGKFVFHQGDKGKKFYIILTGKVAGVLEPRIDTMQHKGIFFEKELFKLEEGSSFGELALISNNTRSCSIKAVTFTQLISLSKKTYLENFGDYVTSLVKQSYKFISSIPEIGQNFRKEEIELISNQLRLMRYPHNCVVQEQGVPVSSVFILRSGSYFIERAVEWKSLLVGLKSKLFLPSKTQLMGKNVAKSNESILRMVEKMLEKKSDSEGLIYIRLKTVTRVGAFCSLFECLESENARYRIITELPSTFFTCSIFDLKKLMNQLTSREDKLQKLPKAKFKKSPNDKAEILKNFVDFEKNPPNDTLLLSKLIESILWKRFRYKVTTNCFDQAQFHKFSLLNVGLTQQKHSFRDQFIDKKQAAVNKKILHILDGVEQRLERSEKRLRSGRSTSGSRAHLSYRGPGKGVFMDKAMAEKLFETSDNEEYEDKLKLKMKKFYSRKMLNDEQRGPESTEKTKRGLKGSGGVIPGQILDMTKSKRSFTLNEKSVKKSQATLKKKIFRLKGKGSSFKGSKDLKKFRKINSSKQLRNQRSPRKGAALLSSRRDLDLSSSPRQPEDLTFQKYKKSPLYDLFHEKMKKSDLLNVGLEKKVKFRAEISGAPKSKNMTIRERLNSEKQRNFQRFKATQIMKLESLKQRLAGLPNNQKKRNDLRKGSSKGSRFPDQKMSYLRGFGSFKESLMAENNSFPDPLNLAARGAYFVMGNHKKGTGVKGKSKSSSKGKTVQFLKERGLTLGAKWGRTIAKINTCEVERIEGSPKGNGYELARASKQSNSLRSILKNNNSKNFQK